MRTFTGALQQSLYRLHQAHPHPCEDSPLYISPGTSPRENAKHRREGDVSPGTSPKDITKSRREFDYVSPGSSPKGNAKHRREIDYVSPGSSPKGSSFACCNSPTEAKDHTALYPPSPRAFSFHIPTRPNNVFRMLRGRESGGTFRRGSKLLMSQQFMPNKLSGFAGQYNNQAFCGQFSQDGTVFMSACQDHHIRLYNTDTLTEQKAFKDVVARDVGWSIVDTDFSPDQRMIIYSSWSNFVHICNVAAEYEVHEALDFRPESRHFCLFSIKFSPDSREIIAGSSDNSVYIYDIETKKPTLVVDAHTDDVNSVCFAEDSPSMFYSASDDGICKVWDRRLLKGGSNDAVGVLVGHSEGITHVNSKGDGRYLITNSKDQSIKLWDIRRMTNPSKIEKGHVPARRYWDYRWEDHSPRSHQAPCKNDTSLQTYRGHRVLQTLVRAYFSPVESTGQRYIYTGSTDGTVYIYDVVSGETVKKLSGHFATVRDVSWHPSLPILATSSWDCTVGVWEHRRADESDD